MKPILKKVIWVSAISVLVVVAIGAILIGRYASKMNAEMHADPCPAPQLHLAATGLDTINQDAIAVFNLYETNRTDPLRGGLQPYPALTDLARRLGDYADIILEPQRGGEPEHLRIRCGNHFNCHFIYVFDPRVSLSTNSSLFQGQGWQQITNNIFLRM